MWLNGLIILLRVLFWFERRYIFILLDCIIKVFYLGFFLVCDLKWFFLVKGILIGIFVYVVKCVVLRVKVVVFILMVVLVV